MPTAAIHNRSTHRRRRGATTAPQTLAGTSSLYPGLDPRLVPLGAYTGVTSPWGLFDSAGATTEWTEERFVDPFDQQTYRYLGGSSSAGGGVDWAYAYGADFPNTRYLWDGLRVASDVPTPGSLLVTCALCWGSCNLYEREVQMRLQDRKSDRSVPIRLAAPTNPQTRATTRRGRGTEIEFKKVPPTSPLKLSDNGHPAWRSRCRCDHATTATVRHCH